MGLVFSSLFNRLFAINKQCRVLMLGLDNAGKTTILYVLKLGKVIKAIPTTGFNVETVHHRNLEFTIWDVSGQSITPRIKPLWRHYYPNTKAILFVIDSNDSERLEEAREALWLLLTADELRDCPLLVFANKQDLPNAISVTDIANKLRLKSISTRNWYIQECCATNGLGIHSGLEWLSNNLNIE